MTTEALDERGPVGQYGAVDSSTTTLEQVYERLGVGKAQYLYWGVLASIAYFDTAEMVVIATIVPLLRCEWELSLAWETAINVSSFAFTALSGGLLGKLPDIYGRRTVLSAALLSLFLAASTSALAQTKLHFLLLRCLVGVCMGVTFPTVIVFSAEIVKNCRRELGPMLVVFVTNISVFFCAVLAYLILAAVGWRWFVFINAAPLLLCFVGLRCLPESPRYLVVSGRKDEAREAVSVMARWNKVEEVPLGTEIVVHVDQNLGSISDILAPAYRKETILLSMMFFGNLLIIFGTIVFVPIALYSGFCGGEGEAPEHKCEEIKQDSLFQLSIVTSGAVVATVLGYLAAVKAGRCLSFKVFSIGGFLSTLLLYKCFSSLVTTGVFFSLKLFQTSHNMVSLIVVPELYPTAFRNTAIGFINSWGKFGGVVGAGLVYVLYYVSPYLVVSMFVAASCLVMCSSFLWSKETKDVLMVDVEQCE